MRGTAAAGTVVAVAVVLRRQGERRPAHVVHVLLVGAARALPAVLRFVALAGRSALHALALSLQTVDFVLRRPQVPLRPAPRTLFFFCIFANCTVEI